MSDAQTIQFELVSPEKRLVSEPVYMIQIPGDEGVFGVLAGHASLVASLKAGVVELHKEEGGNVHKIFIAGGFADVTGDQCSVLAEEAVNVSDLDKAALEQEIANLRDDISLAEEDSDKARIQKRLELVEAKLSAVTGVLAA